MIHKYSLLKEFKRDKRPIHTCMTQWQAMTQFADTLLAKSIMKHVEANFRPLFNLYKDYTPSGDKGKVIRVAHYNKLELPDDPKAK